MLQNCLPYSSSKIRKNYTKDGKIQKEEIEVSGSKINLLTIRNDM